MRKNINSKKVEGLKITKVQIIWHASTFYEDARFRYSVNYVINNSFVLQFDSETKEFSIPRAAEAHWKRRMLQDQAQRNFDADVIAGYLDLKTDKEN